MNADEYKVESVESKTFAGYKQKADSLKLPQTVKEKDKIYVLYEKGWEQNERTALPGGSIPGRRWKGPLIQ